MPSLPKSYRFLIVLVLLLPLAIAVCAFSALAEAATAAVEVGPVLTLIEEATGHLAAGKGLAGDVLVAWSTPYGAVPSEIRGLRLAASGGALGMPFVIHQATDSLPQVSPDPGWNMKVTPGVGRGFLVTWDDVNPTGGLFARRIRGRENEIVEGYEVEGFSAAVRPAAVALPDGLFLVVYERYDGGIAAQCFDADGFQVGGEFEIAEDGVSPAVVGDAEGNVSIAWFDFRRRVVWVRRFSPADGSPIGERRRLDVLSSDSARVRGATGAGGSSAFTWESDGRVRMQLLGPDGGFRGPRIEVARAPEHAWHDVAVDASGRALVVWVDCCAPGARARAKLWKPNGRPLTAAFVVSTPVREDNCCLGLMRQPAAAARDHGDFFVAWIGKNGPQSPRPGAPAIFGVRVLVRD